MSEISSRLRFSRGALLLLLFILLCGAALRLASLPYEALEGDEIFSRQVVLLSVPSEISAIREDLVHPPLYYFLLQASTRLWGSGAGGLRGFSLLCGIASIGLIALLGRTLPQSRFAGILAAALLALNQIHIFYSQEARSYTWYSLLVLLLVLWVWRVTLLTGPPPTLRHWVLGTVLMTALVYTHYVGAIYVGSAVLALLISRIPVSTRIAAVVCATIAAICFLPWVVAISRVYKEKHGIGNNLDWQGHPNAKNLIQAFASTFGILQGHGTIKIAFLLITFLLPLLLILAVFLIGRRPPLRHSPVLLTLFFLSVLPPVVVFLLSRAPFNLSLFGLRHFLPSIPVLMLLLCSYGIDRLAQRANSRSTFAYTVGSALLLSLTAIPTLQSLVSRPSRIPYNLVSREVERDRLAGVPAYTTWFYGIGGPVNFYCADVCVTELPPDHHPLPSQMVLLYRPALPQELQQYQRLQQEGFVEIEQRYYTNGTRGEFGTTLSVLRRTSPPR
ncbi:MAG: hypothetical protein JWQ49_1683 [Edaphobacter sp.]|nr:hypothetical protein [Edaphobacter sp.]